MATAKQPRSIQLIHEGDGTLGGNDVGKYPYHHFVNNTGVEFESRWPLKIIVCGDDEWIAGCLRFRKNCNIFGLELITEGSIEFEQGDRRYVVGSGELLVIQPGQDYVMKTGGYCRKKIMTIGGYMLPPLLANGWSGVDVLKPADPGRIAGFFDRTYQASQERISGYLNYCSSQAYQLLLELSSDISSIGIPPELNRIICYLEENISGNLTVEEVCDRFALSRSSLFRMFKKHLHCSPTDYLINKRLQIARDLMRSSHYSIKEIASRLGYSNQFFFSSQFKKKFGVAPRTYRKST